MRSVRDILAEHQLEHVGRCAACGGELVVDDVPLFEAELGQPVELRCVCKECLQAFELPPEVHLRYLGMPMLPGFEFGAQQ